MIWSRFNSMKNVFTHMAPSGCTLIILQLEEAMFTFSNLSLAFCAHYSSASSAFHPIQSICVLILRTFLYSSCNGQDRRNPHCLFILSVAVDCSRRSWIFVALAPTSTVRTHEGTDRPGEYSLFRIHWVTMKKKGATLGCTKSSKYLLIHVQILTMFQSSLAEEE